MQITQVTTYANPVHAHLGNVAILDRAADSIESGRVNEGLDRLFDGLQRIRQDMAPDDWVDFARYTRDEHKLWNTMYEEPLTRRAFDKPRGYAGDAIMMDYIYGIHHSDDATAQASPLGREIQRYIHEIPACESVRYRRQHIAQLIDRMAETKSKPGVLAIAAGHLREAELSKALHAGEVGGYVAVDADANSLREVQAHYGRLGVETVHGSVRRILAGKVELGTFDFVYAAGLYDYLAVSVAQALAARMFEMTNPGGLMLIPNFTPQARDRAYLEAFMDWHLIYRDEYEMALLIEGIDAAQIASYALYRDRTGSVVYLAVNKVAA